MTFLNFVIVSIITGIVLIVLDFILFVNKWTVKRMRLYGALEVFRETARVKTGILFNLVNGFIFAFIFFLMQNFSEFVLVNGVIFTIVVWLLGSVHPAFSDIVISRRPVKLISLFIFLGFIKYLIVGIVLALVWHYITSVL